MTDFTSVCLIPARGGSKRIPRKNIQNFCGKPLIAWSIQSAIKSNLFDQIIVSTDDEDIANIARDYGANVPFLRPKKYSDDYANDSDVRQHFLSWLSMQSFNYDLLCYLYATAPFCGPSTLKSCQQLLIEKGVSQVQTITTFGYPIMRALSRDKEGLLSFVWEEHAMTRSQDLIEYFHDAGQCYFFDLSKYGKENSKIGFLLPRDQCQDIDTPDDFRLAEKLFSNVLSNENLEDTFP